MAAYDETNYWVLNALSIVALWQEMPNHFNHLSWPDFDVNLAQQSCIQP